MHFSVIVPVYNSAATIVRTLDSLKEFFDAGDEVIVVDDHGVDDSIRLAREYPIVVSVLPKHAGPATARNKGASLSTHPWLFFVDSDVVCRPGTRDLLVKLASRYNAIQGIYAPISNNTGIATEYQNNYYWYVFNHIAGRPTAVCASFCFAIKKDLFVQAGGFDETITVPTVEDEKLGYSLFQQNVPIYVCSELQVEHLARYRLKEFAKRRFAMAYGQAQAFLKKKNPAHLVKFFTLHTTHKSHHLPSFLCAILFLPVTYATLAASMATRSPSLFLAWIGTAFFVLVLNAGMLLSLAAPSRHRVGILLMFLLDLHILASGIAYGLLHRVPKERR